LQAGDIRVVDRGGVEVEQIFVPAGSFMMGSEYGRESEQPVHEVTLDAFWLDRTEVTNAQFAVFVADTSYQTTSERQGGGHLWTMSGSVFIEGANWRHPRGPGSGLDERDGHPVVQVSWNDATTYCEWTAARLPTEAEWEYVARGPENVLFPWGDVFDGNRLNFCDRNCPLDYADQTVDDGYKYTAPVGAYLDGASWVGAMDMVGNVSEWVNDWYDSRYYYSSPRQNPTGPISSDLYDSKVSRGGGWNITGDGAPLSTFRGGYEPDHQLDTKGFRCATSLRDSVIANPTAEVAVTPALTGNIHVSARISLIDPAGCDQPGNFRDTATIPFQWRYDTNLGPGEYMEVRIEPNPGTASQGKVTSSVNGLWRQAVSVANFDVGAGSYQWVVVHMAADGRTELATSDHGCFTIWSDG
jgi:formylglycine-generating enzyme required for sulfatase activity